MPEPRRLSPLVLRWVCGILPWKYAKELLGMASRTSDGFMMFHGLSACFMGFACVRVFKSNARTGFMKITRLLCGFSELHVGHFYGGADDFAG